jgi:hypothetical protein
LQTSALPLGYAALKESMKHEGGSMKFSLQVFSLQFSAQPQFSGGNTENQKLKTGPSSLPPSP